jgi:hypothetical protein
VERNFSDYIVYADESGDHSLSTSDEDYPVFVLTFCIFKKSEYAEIMLPRLSQIKFKFWGHDAVVLHSHKIRKQKGDFAVLGNRPTHELFVEQINNLISDSPFSVVATVIDKRRLVSKYTKPANPYNLGLLFCLERTSKFLAEQGQKDRLTHIIVEARGKKEDAELELEFRRIVAKDSSLAKFELIFSDKKANGTGLQIADLIAHPIGKHVIKPDQQNRSFDIVKNKFHKYPNYQGRGLKVFPSNKRKAPVYTEARRRPGIPNPYLYYTKVDN